jgi:hypothetical protein
MFKKCKCNKSALVVGLFLGGLHALWALAVAIIPRTLQSGLDWIFNVHFLEPYWVLTSFNFLIALWLTIATFAMGYIATLLFVLLWKRVKVK